MQNSKMQKVFHAAIGLLLLTTAGEAHAAEATTYVLTDALGSPVAYMNEAGEVIERQYYLPDGTPLNGDVSDDAAGYTGHVHDGATDLVYMQARYYDPEIGRFLSVDPVTFSPKNLSYFNRYWYAASNPIKYEDSNGRCFNVPAALACLAFAGFVYAAIRIDQAYEENEPNREAVEEHNKKVDSIQQRLDSGEIDAGEALAETYESLNGEVTEAQESSREIASELGSDLQTTGVPASEIAGTVGIIDDLADGKLQDSESPLKDKD